MFPSLVHRAKSLRHHRSHKDLRREDMRSFHARQASNATSCSWSSRPSTDSGRPSTSKDVLSSSPSSSEWDPLRLHPPLAAARSPYIHPDHAGTSNSMQDRPPPPTRRFRDMHASADYRLEIDDGFDFGFASPIAHPPSISSTPQLPLTSTTTTSRPRTASSTNSNPHHGNTPSSWSSPALSSSSDWDAPESPTASRARLAPPSSGRAPARTGDAAGDRPVTPRHPGNFSTLTTDYFITRGGWKRRGIVFASEETSGPTEDECFEIP